MRQIEKLMNEYSGHMLRLAYFYTKNRHAAEDIVQEVWIKFMASDYEETGQLKSYLTKMTINKCKDFLKSWAYCKLHFQHKFLTTKADPDHVVQQEERSQIGAAVLELSLKYREPIILYYYEELKVKEIAHVLDLSENTVKTRLRRAREQLKPLLHGEWEVLKYE